MALHEVFRDRGLAFAVVLVLIYTFFTATSMIGFIAGAGIIVRNSIILVERVEYDRTEPY